MDFFPRADAAWESLLLPFYVRMETDDSLMLAATAILWRLACSSSVWLCFSTCSVISSSSSLLVVGLDLLLVIVAVDVLVVVVPDVVVLVVPMVSGIVASPMMVYTALYVELEDGLVKAMLVLLVIAPGGCVRVPSV